MPYWFPWMRWCYLRLLGLLQSKCYHPTQAITADILEGHTPALRVCWCRICGAYLVLYAADTGRNKQWREPRAHWLV